MLAKQRRILIPREHWTPFPNYVFTDELRELEQNKAAALYLFMLDWAFHAQGGVEATCAELAHNLQLDARVVRECLMELEIKNYICLRRKGIKRSQSIKNRWQVPAAMKLARSDGWIAVPRFVIRTYIPAYHNAVLLVLLVFFQHLSKKNDCWMGVPTLCKMLNWSPTRVRDSLRMLATIQWRTLGTALPQPAEYTTVQRSKPLANAYSPTVRHYRVRAIEYSRHKTMRARRMFISSEFLDSFQIELDPDLQRELSGIFRYGQRQI